MQRMFLESFLGSAGPSLLKAERRAGGLTDLTDRLTAPPPVCVSRGAASKCRTVKATFFSLTGRERMRGGALDGLVKGDLVSRLIYVAFMVALQYSHLAVLKCRCFTF